MLPKTRIPPSADLTQNFTIPPSPNPAKTDKAPKISHISRKICQRDYLNDIKENSGKI
jgi:hypothetical protein